MTPEERATVSRDHSPEHSQVHRRFGSPACLAGSQRNTPTLIFILVLPNTILLFLPNVSHSTNSLLYGCQHRSILSCRHSATCAPRPSASRFPKSLLARILPSSREVASVQPPPPTFPFTQWPPEFQWGLGGLTRSHDLCFVGKRWFTKDQGNISGPILMTWLSFCQDTEVRQLQRFSSNI